MLKLTDSFVSVSVVLCVFRNSRGMQYAMFLGSLVMRRPNDWMELPVTVSLCTQLLSKVFLVVRSDQRKVYPTLKNCYNRRNVSPCKRLIRALKYACNANLLLATLSSTSVTTRSLGAGQARSASACC